MSLIAIFQELIGAAAYFVLLACFYLMCKRRHYVAFPYFFAYLVAVLFSNLLRRGTHILYPGSSAQYFYLYWCSDVVLVGLSFCVLYEMLESVLTAGTVRVGRSTFFLIIALLLFTSVFLSYLTV